MTRTEDTLFETVACPICAADHPKTLFDSPDLLHPAAETFHMVACTDCGHIYQNPRPTADTIGHYYPNDYHAFPRAIEDEPNPLRRLQRRYGQTKLCRAVVEMAGSSGRVLDVGCATGIFLDGMRRRGWQTVGVEPSTTAAAYARERLKLDVHTGRLEDMSFESASFDVVTLWDVFEHVHNPGETLDEIARIIRPGGWLILSLPNPDSLEAHFFGAHWMGWDLPRHLNLFRPSILRELLARRHMPVVRIRSFIYGHSLLMMSQVQRLKSRGIDSPIVSRILHSQVARLLTMPYYSGPANWFNLSSTMVVFAQHNAPNKK